jgi:hypothetical protein
MDDGALTCGSVQVWANFTPGTSSGITGGSLPVTTGRPPEQARGVLT